MCDSADIVRSTMLYPQTWHASQCQDDLCNLSDPAVTGSRPDHSRKLTFADGGYTDVKRPSAAVYLSVGPRNSGKRLPSSVS